MFFKILKYDLKNNFIRKWWNMLILAGIAELILLIFAYTADQFRIAAELVGGFGAELKHYTYIDIVIKFFGGFSETLWMVIHIVLMFIILYFPFKDLSGYGRQILVYSRSRKSWWYSKCVTAFIWVLAFYSIVWIEIFIFSICTGVQISLTVTELGIDNFPLLSSENTVAESLYIGQPMLIAGFVLPLMTAAAMALLQMFLSLIIRPIYSYIVTIVIYSVTTVYRNPILLTDYGIINRNDIFRPDGGTLNTVTGLMICGAVIFISVFGGSLIFKEYEILNK